MGAARCAVGSPGPRAGLRAGGRGAGTWGSPHLMPSGLASRLRSPEQLLHPRVSPAPSEASQLAGLPLSGRQCGCPRQGGEQAARGSRLRGVGWRRAALGRPGKAAVPGRSSPGRGLLGLRPPSSTCRATVWPGALPQSHANKANPAGQSLAGAAVRSRKTAGRPPRAGSGCRGVDHPGCAHAPRRSTLTVAAIPGLAGLVAPELPGDKQEAQESRLHPYPGGHCPWGSVWAPTSQKSFPWGAGTGLGGREGEPGCGEWLAADLGPRLQ